MKKKIKVVLRPYSGLNNNFTQCCNSMFDYIDDSYTFRIYFYLCRMFNREFNYSFPSIRRIANDCKISEKKVRTSIAWLCDMKFIERKQVKKSGEFINNIYYIRYIDTGEVIDEIIKSDDVIYTEMEVEISVESEYDTHI